MIKLFPYSEGDAARWDEFVEGCTSGTLLHTRRFLSYHGDRFRDASLLVTDERGRLDGVLPAAVDPEAEGRVVSHPGVTYGGLLHAGALRGERMIEALEAVRAFYRERGFDALRYKAVPHIYHRAPSADDLYALFRMGAARYRCDLSCAIDLEARPEPSGRRRRGAAKAGRRGVLIEEGAHLVRPLWRVVEDNLSRKYGLRPAHTAAEMELLHSRFPREIDFAAGLMGGEVVAGVVLFNTPRVVHAQYTASSEAGYDACALDLVFEHCIARAAERGARYFNFGVSTEAEGQRLNAGLYQFKTEFGAGGVVHEFYEISLRS